MDTAQWADDAPERLRREASGGPAKKPAGEAGGQGGRSVAEWVTLGISVAVVLGLVALTTYFHLTAGNDPPVIEVRPESERAYRGGDRFYLPVTVANAGSTASEDVRVTLSVSGADGSRESAMLEVRFLPGGGSSKGVVSFRTDPRQGELTIDGISYLEP